MDLDLLNTLLNELSNKHLVEKYNMMFPKDKLRVSFFINMSSDDAISILSLKNDISKVLEIKKLIDIKQKQTTEKIIKINN